MRATHIGQFILEWAAPPTPGVCEKISNGRPLPPRGVDGNRVSIDGVLLRAENCQGIFRGPRKTVPQFRSGNKKSAAFRVTVGAKNNAHARAQPAGAPI